MDNFTALQISRSIIANLLDKAWELGGYSVGEEEFEKYSYIKDAREHLKEIDNLIFNELNKKR